MHVGKNSHSSLIKLGWDQAKALRDKIDVPVGVQVQFQTKSNEDMVAGFKFITRNPQQTELLARELESFGFHPVPGFWHQAISPKYRDWALEILRRDNDKEIATRAQIQESLHSAIVDHQKQLDNLTQMRMRDLIDDDEYVEKRNNLKSEITRLQEELSSADKRADEWLELSEKTFDFATYARIKFLKGDNQVKREILAALGSDFTILDKKLSLTPHPWLIPLSEFEPSIPSTHQGSDRDDPEKVLINKEESSPEGPDSSLFLRWGAFLKEVRTEIKKAGYVYIPIV